jgi:hypothetical protein
MLGKPEGASGPESMWWLGNYHNGHYYPPVNILVAIFGGHGMEIPKKTSISDPDPKEACILF